METKETKLVDKYLQTETTTTADIALPPDKASGDPSAPSPDLVKRRKKKKKLLDKDDIIVSGE